jgi:demethylmenaquinone methyltransferase/2-methoxy-6-polyprenyl-1,4-benzoquinol methylase
MAEKVKPYKDSGQSKKEQVERMFDTISREYDGLNRVISLGADVRWRKKVISMVLETDPQNILDIATGTGDLALQFAGASSAKVMGLDLSEGMLSVARKKALATALDDKVTFVQGDSEALPFEDDRFDAITVSFGIRNFENLEKGLKEIHRVLATGGTFVILETSVPQNFPFKQGYYLYTRAILPLVGRIFSRDKVAYRYLSDSAAVFPFGEKLNNILRNCGFIDVENRPQTFGVATIYRAVK